MEVKMQRKITGTLYSYYFVCKRKLWYSAHNIDMEQENDNVLIGRLIDENSYAREDKSILIDETINIDFFRKNVIHEVKKSNHFDEVAINQAKYYIYYLQKLGMDVEKAVVDYPLLKLKKEVFLSDCDVQEVEKNLIEIQQVITMEKPPPDFAARGICKKCAFYDLCFV
jgi:CRISPR-associated exonuclease Cas4